jgi:hypothetical protein
MSLTEFYSNKKGVKKALKEVIKESGALEAARYSEIQ